MWGEPVLTRRQVLGLLASGVLGAGAVGLAPPAAAAGTAIDRFRAVLSAGGTVRLVAVGSSTTAGTGATSKSRRYVDLLARRLQADRGRAGGGIYLDVNGGWRFTGTTSSGTAGLSLTYRRLEAGAAMTRSSSVPNCSSVTLTHAEGPGLGPFTVTLGGVPYTVSPRTDGTAVRYSGVFRTPSQALGTHPLTITAGASPVLLDGFYAHAGDEESGVQVWQGGKPGANAGSFGRSPSLPARLASLGVDLVVLMIGSNDYEQGRSISTYTSDVRSFVANAKAASPGVLVLLVHSYQRMDVTTPRYPWSAYGAALAGIADADPDNVAFLDLSDDFAARGVPGTDPEGLIGADDVHCTDAGYRVLTDLVYAPMSPTVTPAPEQPPPPPPPPPSGLAVLSSDTLSGPDAPTCVGRTTDGSLGGSPATLVTSSTAAALAVVSGAIVRGGTRTGQFAALPMPSADQSLSLRVADPPDASGSGGVQLVVRRSQRWTSASYRASLGPSSVTLERTDGNGVATRLAPPVPLAAGDTVELSAVGPSLSLSVNGSVRAQATDTTVGGAGLAGLAVGSWASGFQVDDLVWRVAT